MKRGTKLAALLLSLALIIPACTQKGSSEPKPVDQSSQPSDVSSDDQPGTSDEVKYVVTISNKTELQAEWFAGDPSRKVNIEIEPKANITQLVNEGKIQITSSNAEVASVTGQMVNPVAAGKATITVKCGDSQDTVEVTLLAKQTVKEKYGVAHEGTAEDPFDNEDACKVAKSDKYNNEDFYVKGVVDRFYYAPGSRTDGNVAFYLVPAQEGGEQFEVFKCYKDKEQKEKLTDDDIWVGGTVVAHGQFTVYNGTQAETTSAIFVSCEGNKPQPRQTLEKTFAEVLAVGNALKDGDSTWDYYKFQGFVTVKSGNDYFLTASKGEALVSGKSDEAHGSRDIKGTNAIELYGAGKVEALAAKLLEGAKVEVTMLVKNYHGTVENGVDLTDADVVVKEAGTAWSVPEPAVENKTVTEFVALENSKAKAYNVTATIKSWKNASSAKDKYGNMVITDGTTDLVIYGASATATALAWDNASAYAFTNPQDFLTNEVTAALNIGNEITMKLIRADYKGTVQGTGIITSVAQVEATAIALNKTTAEIEVEGSVTLEATLTPANANSPITWISSDEAVATVAAGVVTGVAAGSATITAKVSDAVKAECVVTVKAPAAGVLKATLKYNGTENKTCANFEGDALTEILNLNKDIFTVTYDKNGVTSEMALRTDGIRMYATKQTTNGNKITVSIASGYKIKDVNIAYDTNYSATSVVSAGSTAVTAVDGVYAINGSSFTVFNDNSGVSSNTQVRFQKIDITYEEAGSVTPVENEVMPWYTEGTGNQAIHFEGAGIWTWVNYGTMGYTDFNAFNAAKENIVAAYESEPAATINDKVVSDDIAASKVCRVYIVLSAAYNTGKLTLTIPGADGKTYEGTLEFAEGALKKVNGVAL